MPLINLLALLVPAGIGVAAAVLLGHKQVRTLREVTGDNSPVLRVLSADMHRVPEPEKDREAA